MVNDQPFFCFYDSSNVTQLNNTLYYSVNLLLYYLHITKEDHETLQCLLSQLYCPPFLTSHATLLKNTKN